jgi:hypothetical protein
MHHMHIQVTLMSAHNAAPICLIDPKFPPPLPQLTNSGVAQGVYNYKAYKI